MVKCALCCCRSLFSRGDYFERLRSFSCYITWRRYPIVGMQNLFEVDICFLGFIAGGAHRVRECNCCTNFWHVLLYVLFVEGCADRGEIVSGKLLGDVSLSFH